MKSRIIIGSVATCLFLSQYITVNKLQFPYPYIQQPKNSLNPIPNSFRPNSYLLSIKNTEVFSRDNLSSLQPNDLVLCETPKGQHVFKIVGAVSQGYTPFENGISSKIPPGFVFLIEPFRKEIGMENIAVVKAKKHYSLGKWDFSWWHKLMGTQPKTDDKQQVSLQRQILQRNNIQEQINMQQYRNKRGNQEGQE